MSNHADSAPEPGPEPDLPVDPAADYLQFAEDLPEVDPYEGIEVPEPEESQWPEGTSPYDADTEDAEQDLIGPAFTATGLASFVRSGAAAVRWALDQHSWQPPGMCQQFTRSAFNVGAYFGSAISAWNGADHKHPNVDPNTCPRATGVYFSGGSRGFGHATVSLGHGLVRSTDWPSAGRVGTARITDIERAWGMHFLGWTEDINNVVVWEKPDPMVDASMVAHAARHGLATPHSRLVKRAVAKEVGGGSMHLDKGALGAGFRAQYKLVQAEYLKHLHRKASKDAIDGIPGPASLEWLGKRHGFRVHL